MFFSRHGGGWQAFDSDIREIASYPGRHPHAPHIDNFFDCVVSRATPNADIEEGHRSTVLCHLGNIAMRLGRKIRWDPETETCPDDPEATAMLRRPYRAPWKLA